MSGKVRYSKVKGINGMAVIVGSGQGENKKKRLLGIAGIVVLLVLAGAAGVGLRLLQDGDKSEEPAGTKGSSFSSTVDDIQDLRAKGDLEGATARINQALQDPNLPDKERYNIYIQQGNASVDRQDYTSAIVAYEKAAAITKTYEAMLLLGDMWAQVGDKAKAVDYYKKALPLVPAGPLEEENKKSLQAMITQLEAEI